MVHHADDWPWSSYRATVERNKAPDWLENKWILNQFGSRKQAAQSAYRRFVSEGIRSPSPWDSLRSQVWLGEEEFLTQMKSLIKGKRWNEVPQVQQLPNRPQAEMVLRAVSETYDVERRDILNRSHLKGYTVAVYLLRRVVNMHLREVADLFRISVSRVSKIQKCVEEGKAGTQMTKLLKKYKVKI